MISEQAYKDTSPYEGWLQFFDDEGQEWQAEYKGCQNWLILKYDGDCFHSAGFATAKGNARPRTVLKAYNDGL